LRLQSLRSRLAPSEQVTLDSIVGDIDGCIDEIRAVIFGFAVR
jgi:hypothetical protein